MGSHGLLLHLAQSKQECLQFAATLPKEDMTHPQTLQVRLLICPSPPPSPI